MHREVRASSSPLRFSEGKSPLRAIGRQIRDQGGVTLTETIVALAIISMTFVGFISALSTGSIASRVYAENVTAIGIAKNQMEYTKNALYVSPPYTYESIIAPSGYSVSSEAYDYNGDPNLEKIIVTVYRDGEVVQVLEDLKVLR